jgi:4-aminobutyrate aminotransferase
MPEIPTDFVAIAHEHMSPVLGRYYERPFERGDGHYIFEPDGTRYLDFACGIATTVLGHRHPAVTRAITEQADRLLHLCNAVGYVEPTARLAAEIAATMPEPLDTVFFGNSGAEAIEGAVKLARRVTGRPAIVGFSGAFHGRTATAIALTTSSINYRIGYEPMVPSVYHAPFPDVYHDGGEEAATRKALAGLDDLFASLVPPSAVAAIVIEPVQGEGGFRPAPVAFLRELRRICTQHGIMLVADEIQAGYARTGRMWSFEHAGIVPDVVCLAKAIANGLPLSAIVSSRALQLKWGVAAHGTTFGGNPVSCAAGLAVLRTIRDENLVENAAVRGAELRSGLEALAAQDEGIGDVRGPGLMIGVEFVKDRATKVPDGERAERLMARCADLGLLVLVCGVHHQVMRWIPPLDVSAEEIADAVRIFGQALVEDRAAARG